MLSHILLSLRNTEEQLKVNSTILRSLHCGSSSEALSRGLPDYIKLPIGSLEELDQIEKGLADVQDKQRLVGIKSLH